MTNYLRTHVAGLTTTVRTRNGLQPYINFDNAASTPPFVCVLDALTRFAPWYASVHRGNGYKSRISTEAYEQSHRIVGDFVGADAAEHTVIFTKNTTEALNKLAFRLPLRRHDIVLISHLEHHSNDLPWRAQATVKRINMLPNGSIDTAHYLALLKRYAGHIKLVALTGASNVTGHMPDIYWFARKAHTAGAQIVVDAAQLAAHRPIQIGRLNQPDHLDYVVLSAHKMYAPFGSGALIGRNDTFAVGTPEYPGGGTVNAVTTNSVDWAEAPDRDEAGSPNVIGAIAMAQAMQKIKHLGFEAIMHHEITLTRYALTQLSSLDEVTIYGNTDPALASHRGGVIPFTIRSMPAALVAAILGSEWGMGVRSGCFCAQPYVMSLLGQSHTDILRVRRRLRMHDRRQLPGMVRISFGLYNTPQEVDSLVTALRAIIAGDYGTYTQDPTTGHYQLAAAEGDLALGVFEWNPQTFNNNGGGPLD